MKMRPRPWYLLLLLALLGQGWMDAQATPPSASNDSAQDAMSRDLLEVTIPELEQMYSSHKYTVTEVVQWYLARIAKYNGIYRAVQTVDSEGALATAAREDAEAAAGGSAYQRGPMWGVPIVTKANTSIKGLITTDGWKGYMIPGHELIAPKDATIVAKLRAAGAVIVGQTNMPDFAASDTNRSTAYGRTGNAYDVRFSPGGSSGRHRYCRHRKPRGAWQWDRYRQFHPDAGRHQFCGWRSLTRGLVSIAGIAPLDWLLDNTGPIARDVTDAAVALDVMAGPDPLDARTADSVAMAERGPYTASPESRHTQGETLRRTRIHSPGSRRSIPGNTGGRLCEYSSGI